MSVSSMVAAVVFAGSVALLAGCADSGGLAPESRIADADHLSARVGLQHLPLHDAAWPERDWYTRYQDPQLARLIDQAMASSPNLRVADARVRQAAAAGAMAASALSPEVAAGARSARQRHSTNSTIPKPLAGTWAWGNDLSFNLSYELDFWGKNEAALQGALGRQRASEVEAAAARLMLSVAITQSYVRVAQIWTQLDLANEVLAQREAVLKLTSERVQARIDSAVDLKQAELAVPVAREQVAASREALALARYQLAALLGAGPDRGDAITQPKLLKSPPAALPSALPSELIARRPDIVAQRWRVEAASQDIKVARAQFLPSFNLGALIGLQSLGFDRLLDAGSRVTGVSGALNLPIFDGGWLRGNLAARDAEYDAAVEQYNQTLVDAVRDVVSQLTSIGALSERARFQSVALATARQAHALALERYRAGLGNYLQVLAAQSQLLTQSRASIDLDSRAFELDISLVRALGGGYPAPANQLNPISSR